MSRSNASLQVVASYKGTVLDVAHLRAGRGTGRYTVGEGQGASFAAPPVDSLTPEGFELARILPSGACWVRFVPSMRGEIVAEGRRDSLEDWMAAGWTVAEDGAHGTTLPAGARCVIRHGELTFHLCAVESVEAPTWRPEVDAPFWSICAATFVVLTSLLVLAHFAAPAAAHLDLEQHARTNRFVGYVRAADAAPKPKRSRPTRYVEDSPRPERSTPTPPARPEPVAELGPAADPDPTIGTERPDRRRGAARPIRGHGAFARSDMRAAADLMARGDGPIERARRAGALAFVDTRPLVDNAYASAFSPDADDRAMWEAQKALDPTTRSIAGLDLIGKGRGGGPGSADDLASTEPDDAAEDVGERDPTRVIVRAGAARVRGPRARDAVRGVVLRHAAALRRCYEDGFERDPELGSRATVELDIDASGDVVGARVSRISRPAVGECMTAEAKSWRFGEVTRRATSHVTVPLTFRRR
ncbi:MAG: AgmX/PglI C-terminal domain-containing protein [Nannocystaceae bacterium]|nr:AgmX/PglI C-terminal domain-containing protein [bacterium]